ncbi:hypothetical protein [Roseicyclus mahoneyensis]|uniref:Uncharacterized protein n=1 Tax=Roseicyclus mahoneyensis TaxID=164332 RepID=A0A316GME2_9RHOB|nr:hypothetical protein [Roseicyclus mahoneyensis]PWK61459.1 hypothetical protein C7455_102148 [Roseicyclus mahoneyensis]
MQVDRELGQDKASQIDPIPGHAELLEAARHHALRMSTSKDLRTLILRLYEACETARVAAISALHEPALRSGGEEATDHNFGFADLFAALRRARAEVAVRELGHPKSLSPKSPNHPRSGGPPAATLSTAILAQQKARR